MMVLGAQDLPPAQIAPAVHRITAAEKAAIATAVANELRDPESARFRWLPNMSINGRYCGLVNGKNGFGGYVGFVPFQLRVVHSPSGSIAVEGIQIGTEANMSKAIISGCALVGLDLSSASSD
jgi:hypothetical protein